MNRRCGTPKANLNSSNKKRTFSYQFYSYDQRESSNRLKSEVAVISKESYEEKLHREIIKTPKSDKWSAHFKELISYEEHACKKSSRLLGETEIIKIKYNEIKKKKQNIEEQVKSAKNRKNELNYSKFLENEKSLKEDKYQEVKNKEKCIKHLENEIKEIEKRVKDKIEANDKLYKSMKINDFEYRQQSEREQALKNLMIWKTKLISQINAKQNQMALLINQKNSLIKYSEYLSEEKSRIYNSKKDFNSALQKVDKSIAQLKSFKDSLSILKENISNKKKSLSDLENSIILKEKELDSLNKNSEITSRVAIKREEYGMRLTKLNCQDETIKTLAAREEHISVLKEKNSKMQEYLEDLENKIKLSTEIIRLKNDAIEHFEIRQANVELHKEFNRKRKERELDLIDYMKRNAEAKEEELTRKEVSVRKLSHQ
ncbi:unnamed protein product [Blepharisma stoltei]|uniref:Uncharacterized protein n=1 Tax=Blepharisma stoltei TaxID=1481888 RepID=A0AAU9JFT1_9CILI|nr:unnamed protein product [Blepharisma stoltei]